MRNRFLIGAAVTAFVMAPAVRAEPQPENPAPAASTPAQDLLEGFRNPPQSARPRTWWHWIDGNITREGIAADLHWMKEVGLGGVQMFDVGLSTRQVVKDRMVYMSPAWKDAFGFAAETAKGLGLEMTIASSPGWSETGGPWVEPAQAMKKLVWSRLSLAGGQRFHGTLPAPPSVTGPYMAMPLSGSHPSLYGDTAVLAFREPAQPADLAPRLTNSGEPLDAGLLARGEPGQFVRVTGDGAGPTIEATFDQPAALRSATVFVRDGWRLFDAPSCQPRLEAFENGAWRKLADLPPGPAPTTVSFAPVTATRFRLVLGPPAARPDWTGFRSLRVQQFSLSSTAVVNRFEAKAGFSIAADYQALGTPPEAEVRGIDPANVIDLTDRMRPDGTLDWNVPKGRWTVLRLGWSLQGATNHPATPESTGLEADKYDAAAVRSYMDRYLASYRSAIGRRDLQSAGIGGLLTDSIEVGASNWTPHILDRFRELRGYDPRPWLPALTGVIVGSRQRSDAFLHDFRQTLADLIARDHYGAVAQAAHDAGLVVYGESLEGSRVVMGDDMAMRSHADVPMAALWTYPVDGAPPVSSIADLRGASSVAHVYGRPYAAAESMTSLLKLWAYAPADLRHVIDMEFSQGINRPVIHTSVHQPVDAVPGLTLSVFGQTFNRLETWSGMARPWIDYIARSSFLLQQGRNVADLAYYPGDDTPVVTLFGDEPRRFGYDFVNTDMLEHALSARDGAIVSTGGARYRALYLGRNSASMTLATLRRVATLVDGGATVIGTPPLKSPALGDDSPQARADYASLVDRMWHRPATSQGGHVIGAANPEAGLEQMGLAPDLARADGKPLDGVLWVHRQSRYDDIYFVNNSAPTPARFEARFRAAGASPQLWHADTGDAEAISGRSDGEATIIPLDLAAHDSVFVVFRRRAAPPPPQSAPLIEVGTVKGPWHVAFQPGRGAPAGIEMPRLGLLTGQSDPGVKYFSGVATYSTRFKLRHLPGKGGRFTVDLGDVGSLARVRLNGRDLGVAWHKPFRLEAGSAVKKGTNTLDVEVADLWVNRLIGDAQPGANKVTSATASGYSSSSPLVPSGLIGPVHLFETEAR